MNVEISGMNGVKRVVRASFAWWMAGLLFLLPETLRQKIIHTPNRLTIEKNDGEFLLMLYRGDTGELLERHAFQQDNELDKAAVVQWLSGLRQDDTEIVVIIPETQVLVKLLALPLASASDLNNILGFEMDRQTPFTSDKVYYDSTITSLDQEQQKIHLRLFVVLREKIDPLLEEFNSWRIKPWRLTPGSNGNPVEEINLLPETLRPTRNRQINPVTRALAIASIVLFIALLYVPLARQQQIMANLDSQLSRTREQAKQVLPLIREKEQIISRTQFLTGKQKDQALAINILRELTTILPDDTWLNRLIIRDDEVQLHGESDNASSIIQLIENSDYFKNAQFRSPVTRNNMSQKDKFHVSATINGEEPS